MILVIDNYDSFTFNLVHYLGEIGHAATVRRNDALTVQDAIAMAPEAIVTAQCDVLSPNALGAILNDETIPKLKARVVAGAANNQLPHSTGFQGDDEHRYREGIIDAYWLTGDERFKEAIDAALQAGTTP